jgi:hypothetical protein
MRNFDSPCLGAAHMVSVTTVASGKDKHGERLTPKAVGKQKRLSRSRVDRWQAGRERSVGQY